MLLLCYQVASPVCLVETQPGVVSVCLAFDANLRARFFFFLPPPCQSVLAEYECIPCSKREVLQREFTFPDGSVLSSSVREGSRQSPAAKTLLFKSCQAAVLGCFVQLACLHGLIIDDEVGKQQEV